MEQKLYQLLPANDSAMGTIRYNAHSQMLGSCAVVGNSGSLLYRQYGRAIDAHDVVYRFNQVSPSTTPLHFWHSSDASTLQKWLRLSCPPGASSLRFSAKDPL